MVDDHEPLSENWRGALGLGDGASFADAACMVLSLFVEQTSLTGPQDFSSKAEAADHDVRELHPLPSDDSAFQP